eukprot:TRINITY_DN66155_c0_g1_i1.p1 TRINITY_DN66155_c0_g1~~TRINITY_DN66155_c0_g1_i1.p1  ORF type:complete len:223 (-),score=38.07 TRINITY_DN66155_c0_g1_i1:55-723(-)
MIRRDGCEVKVQLLAHPRFLVTCACPEKTLGASVLREALSAIEDSIRSKDGDFRSDRNLDLDHPVACWGCGNYYCDGCECEDRTSYSSDPYSDSDCYVELLPELPDESIAFIITVQGESVVGSTIAGDEHFRFDCRDLPQTAEQLQVQFADAMGVDPRVITLFYEGRPIGFSDAVLDPGRLIVKQDMKKIKQLEALRKKRARRRPFGLSESEKALLFLEDSD